MTKSDPSGRQGEAPIDPDRPIVDAHLHLWEILPAPGSMHEPQCFLLPELLVTVYGSGHNITHTVFVECHAMHKMDGPIHLRSVGEVEFANGVAAVSASGNYGPCRVAAGIVGNADLRLGEDVAPVLEALQAAGGGRLRGIRYNTAYSQGGMFGMPCDPEAQGAMMDRGFREGVRVLERMKLSLDIWCFHSQLGEVIDLAGAFPDLPIILDHAGTPETLGAYAGREKEALAEWRRDIVELSRRQNVTVKLGGLGMELAKPIGSRGTASSEFLAASWGPCLHSCIEAFTPQRCMFESNFPPDRAASTYGTVWNAFKRIAAAFAEAEKTALFSGTARRVYRL